MAYFDVCPHCGANLDPGETCDCQMSIQKNDNQREEEEEIKKAGNRLQALPA